MKILPVIMCAGAGPRVRPESPETLPKQFIPLIGSSTFQMAIAMLDDPGLRLRARGGGRGNIAAARGPDTIVVMLAGDYVVQDSAGLVALCKQAAEAAA